MKMRDFALAFACGAVLWACTPNPPAPQSTGPATEVPCGPGPQPNGDPCP